MMSGDVWNWNLYLVAFYDGTGTGTDTTRQAWLCLFFFCFLSEQETSFCVKLKQLDSKLADQADKAVGIAEKSRADQFPAWK
jgi:hypothetical protein